MGLSENKVFLILDHTITKQGTIFKLSSSIIQWDYYHSRMIRDISSLTKHVKITENSKV